MRSILTLQVSTQMSTAIGLPRGASTMGTAKAKCTRGTFQVAVVFARQFHNLEIKATRGLWRDEVTQFALTAGERERERERERVCFHTGLLS